MAGRGWIIWYRARQSRGKPGVAVGRCAWLAAGHDLALLDRGDAVAEQGLAIEDLLQVASQLGLEAVAAQTGAHVELGRRWRLGRLLISACTPRVETGSKSDERRVGKAGVST